jgi:hypothetical protein
MNEMQSGFHLITLCSWKDSYEYNSKASQPSLRSIACIERKGEEKKDILV